MPTRLSDLPGLPPFPADDLLTAMGRDKKVENARPALRAGRGHRRRVRGRGRAGAAVRAVLAADDG
jgi:hypothetical protein